MLEPGFWIWLPGFLWHYNLHQTKLVKRLCSKKEQPTGHTGHGSLSRLQNSATCKHTKTLRFSIFVRLWTSSSTTLQIDPISIVISKKELFSLGILQCMNYDIRRRSYDTRSSRLPVVPLGFFPMRPFKDWYF